MFGINSFEQVSQIAEGHLKELTKQENALYESRMEICKKCPLFSDTLGGICDSKKCWNTESKQLVKYPGEHVTCGCGCRLSAKTRLKNAHCVLNKW